MMKNLSNPWMAEKELKNDNEEPIQPLDGRQRQEIEDDDEKPIKFLDG